MQSIKDFMKPWKGWGKVPNLQQYGHSYELTSQAR